LTRPRLVAVVVLLALLATVAVVLVRPGATPTPAEDAADSCTKAERFERLVEDNASAEQVLEVLGEAERKAASAADRDPVWLALSGGLQSVRIALNADDARAARVGIDVVRAECRRVRSR
jgi:hypothetical protein